MFENVYDLCTGKAIRDVDAEYIAPMRSKDMVFGVAVNDNRPSPISPALFAAMWFSGFCMGISMALTYSMIWGK